jgi:hypothetical protein
LYELGGLAIVQLYVFVQGRDSTLLGLDAGPALIFQGLDARQKKGPHIIAVGMRYHHAAPLLMTSGADTLAAGRRCVGHQPRLPVAADSTSPFFKLLSLSTL